LNERLISFNSPVSAPSPISFSAVIIISRTN